MNHEPAFGAIADVDLGAVDRPLEASGMHVSTGIILFDEDGKIWIYEPLNHYGGYQHTSPKGRVEPGLTQQQNAHKEVFEEQVCSARLPASSATFGGIRR